VVPAERAELARQVCGPPNTIAFLWQRHQALTRTGCRVFPDALQVRPVARDVVYEIHPGGKPERASERSGLARDLNLRESCRAGARETDDTSYLRPVFKPMTPDERKPLLHKQPNRYVQDGR
jgi:hypothetical protein